MSRFRTLPLAAALVTVLPSSTPAQRPEPPFFQSVAWSPDGKTVVTSGVLESWDDGFKLYLVSVETGDMREVDTRGGTRVLYPVFTADGHIVFGMVQDSVRGVYMVRPDGSGLRRVVAGAGVGAPSFAPDGSRFAYNAEVDGKRQVMVANADGTNSRRVSPGAGNNWNPQWSPDGQWIAYYSDREGGGAHDTVYVAAPDGSEERKVTSGVFATWTPDGRLLFSGGDGDGAGMFVVDRNGANRRRLVERAVSGAMSWDGKWLAIVAYATQADGPNRYRIDVLRPDGSERRTLVGAMTKE